MTPEIPTSPSRRTWAEIDLEALRHNAAAVRNQAGAEVRIMAIVKANAYGHGLGPVVRALADRVDLFGVANVVEGRELRTHLPKADVFILGPALPEERAEIVASGFIPSVSNADEAQAFGDLAKGEPIPIHFIVDTGMGRIGVWQEEALAMMEKIVAVPGVKITGVASHLPAADEDNHFTQRQLVRFHALLVQIRLAGITAPVVHIENSAGVLGHAQQAGDMVRPGIMLYGHSPLPQWQHCLRPALTWKARVTLVRAVAAGRSISYGRTYVTPRATRIATLGVGYADGYQRHLSGQNAYVLLRGRRCSVVGRVTMDQIMVDVGGGSEVVVGDEAVLIGQQDREEITVGELAKKAGTIPWEIFTGIGPRVAREYIGV
jgi:alanine racemase